MTQAQESEEPRGQGLIRLVGEYGLARAAELHAALRAALEGCDKTLVLDVASLEGADITVYQLLFSLAAQAKLDGKSVLLKGSITAQCFNRAASLGITQHDFDQAFTSQEYA